MSAAYAASYFITTGISETIKYIFVSKEIKNQATHLFSVNFKKKQANKSKWLDK